MKLDLRNFNCIITAGTGALGNIVVGEFIKNGARVFTNYRNQEKFNTLKQSVESPEKLDGAIADLTRESDVKNFFTAACHKLNRIDIFIHLVGGFWMGGEICETPLDRWKQMMDMNLLSTFLATREAFSLFKSQCHGKIFTVSAKSALDLPAEMGAYAISKAGVLALTEILAKEGKPYNIHVNSILPSIIDTPANRNSMPNADFSEWVNPKDIASLLINLSKPESKALSGSALKVYGKL